MQSVTRIYNYFKKFGYKTVVMGASFRNIGEITELAGCDLLTISPQLLAELESTQADLPRKLDPANAKTMKIEKITMDKATFDSMHAADRMATDKLKEGIEGFSAALVKLEGSSPSASPSSNSAPRPPSKSQCNQRCPVLQSIQRRVLPRTMGGDPHFEIRVRHSRLHPPSHSTLASANKLDSPSCQYATLPIISVLKH